MSACNMLNRANTLINNGYREDLPSRFPDMRNDYTDLRSSFANMQSDYTDSETWEKFYLKNSLVNGARKFVTPLEKLQEEYISGEMGILNRKGRKFLTRLYGNNEEFREEIINFVRDKKELDLELILDKRCKTNTLNTLGNKYLGQCITSKDKTKDLIEVVAKFYLQTDEVRGKPSSLVNHEQSSLENGKPCYTNPEQSSLENHEQSSFTDLRNG